MAVVRRVLEHEDLLLKLEFLRHLCRQSRNLRLLVHTAKTHQLGFADFWARHLFSDSHTLGLQKRSGDDREGPWAQSQSALDSEVSCSETVLVEPVKRLLLDVIPDLWRDFLSSDFEDCSIGLLTALFGRLTGDIAQGDSRNPGGDIDLFFAVLLECAERLSRVQEGSSLPPAKQFLVDAAFAPLHKLLENSILPEDSRVGQTQSRILTSAWQRREVLSTLTARLPADEKFRGCDRRVQELIDYMGTHALVAGGAHGGQRISCQLLDVAGALRLDSHSEFCSRAFGCALKQIADAGREACLPQADHDAVADRFSLAVRLLRHAWEGIDSSWLDADMNGVETILQQPGLQDHAVPHVPETKMRGRQVAILTICRAGCVPPQPGRDEDAGGRRLSPLLPVVIQALSAGFPANDVATSSGLTSAGTYFPQDFFLDFFLNERGGVSVPADEPSDEAVKLYSLICKTGGNPV